MLRQINFEKGNISRVQFSLKNDETYNGNKEENENQNEQEEGEGSKDEEEDEDEERAASQSFISSLLVHGNCLLPTTHYLLPPVYLTFNQPLST